MKCHLYVVEHDKGFAPNPFFGVCTLACCKPRIRQKADVGDYVIGLGSAGANLTGRLIYWMMVAEIVTFDEYWAEPRFIKKRAQMGGSLMECYGDNIYHRDPKTKTWIQAHSFHSDRNDAGSGNLANDTGRTENVLIANRFGYWGGSGPIWPPHLEAIRPRGRAERCRLTSEQVEECIAFVEGLGAVGYTGEPADWKRDHKPDKIGRYPVADPLEPKRC